MRFCIVSMHHINAVCSLDAPDPTNNRVVLRHVQICLSPLNVFKHIQTSRQTVTSLTEKHTHTHTRMKSKSNICEMVNKQLFNWLLESLTCGNKISEFTTNEMPRFRVSVVDNPENWSNPSGGGEEQLCRS